jgi:hypothetical protein
MTYKSITALQADIASFIPDNTQSLVSPSDVRNMLLDITDSYSHLIRYTMQSLTDGATINWDASSGLIARVTLGGNRTMAFPTNLVEGDTFTIFVVQDGSGNRTLTWNGKYNFDGGAPTLSTTGDAVDKFTFVAFDSNGTIVGVEGSGGMVPVEA